MVKELSNDVKYNREKIETIEEKVLNLGEIVETNGEKLDQHLNPPGKLHLPMLIHICKEKNLKIAWLETGIRQLVPTLTSNEHD